MKKILKCVTIILYGFSALVFLQFLSLAGTVNEYKRGNVISEGDGIGVTFLGIEINDTVPWSEVYIYRDLFLKILIISVLIASLITIVYKKLKPSERTYSVS